jgi:hypothetical protein
VSDNGIRVRVRTNAETRKGWHYLGSNHTVAPQTESRWRRPLDLFSAVSGVHIPIVSITPVRRFSLRHLSSKTYKTILCFPRGRLLCVYFRVLQIFERIKEEVNVNFKDDGSKNMA